MMTDFETALDLARQIQSDDAARLREEGFRLQDERIEKRAAQTKEEQAEKSNLMTAILVNGGAAYAARLNALTGRIDLHQSATIEALLDNQQNLDAVQSLLDNLLSKAYVLPDGRRVFKSEDGERVYDEHGIAVSIEEIDPDMIDETHPTWESFHDTLEAKRKLDEEREALVAHQDKLDHAQALIDRGGLSEDELAELDDLMTRDVPEAVRTRLSASDPAYRSNATPDAALSDDFDGSEIIGPKSSRFGFD